MDLAAAVRGEAPEVRVGTPEPPILQRHGRSLRGRVQAGQLIVVEQDRTELSGLGPSLPSQIGCKSLWERGGHGLLEAGVLEVRGDVGVDALAQMQIEFVQGGHGVASLYCRIC